MNFRNSFIITAFGLVAFFFVSCGAVDKPIKDYTPVNDLSGLELDESASPSLAYIRPGHPGFEEYNSFSIDEITVDQRDQAAKALKPEHVEKIETYFHDRLVMELTKHGYEFTEDPGEKTLRMSFTLSGIKNPTAVPNASTVAVSAVTSAVVPVAVTVGGVTVEGSFTDGSSNLKNAVWVTRAKGSHLLNNSPWSTWKDVESSLNKWAKGIGKGIDKANKEG